MRVRQVFLCQTAKPRMCHLVFLAASAQLFQPRAAYLVPETSQPSQVVRYRMIVEVAPHDLCQPCANLTYRFVSLQFQLCSDRRKCGSQPFLDRQSQYLEAPLPGLRAAVREAEKVECFRPSQPSFLAPLFSVTSKFYQPRFLRMKRQPEFGKAFSHCLQKLLGFFFVL